MNCRHCRNSLSHVFIDLGFAPPSNSYISADQLQAPETYFPLKLFVCENCWLVQTDDYAGREQLFSADYAYFSSISSSWMRHAQTYCEAMIERLRLGPRSFVVEIASNDGYLLRNFVAAGIPSLGIEPTESTARAAERLGIPVVKEFFGVQLAASLASERKADLIIGNNVYAHVPDINDFTCGMKQLLADEGTITLEFPHLLRLIEQIQFDTIYHEHFSYLSLRTVDQIFREAGLRVYDVEELPTHGGSLRVFGCHADDERATADAPRRVLENETAFGLQDLGTYLAFQSRADEVKNEFLLFLIEQKKNGRRVAGYGAAAKGNTLLNYAGVKSDLVPFVCDAAPSKQGKFLPGSHIPVVSPEMLRRERPDIVVIFPWNIAEEIVAKQAGIRDWGGKFAVAVPTLSVF